MTLPIILLALTAAPQSDLIIDWDRRFQVPGSSVEVPSSVVVLPNGGLILTEGGVIFPGAKITRLDDTGATVWETDLFQGPNPYVIVGADTDRAGGVVVMATRFGDGSSLWQATLAASATGSRVLDYAPAQGGGVYACGWAACVSERRGLIQRISASSEAGPARLFGEGTADRNHLEFSRIVRRGEGLLAIGEAEERVNFPFSETIEGVAMALLPEFGESYCGPAVPNSTGAPAVITAHGEDAAAGSTGLVLRAEGLPPGMTTLFIVGSKQGTIPIPGNGQGIICLGGLLGRYSSQIGFARLDGVSEVFVDPALTPTPAGPLAIAAGQTWNFQVWYRDSNPMATSNASDAVAVTFD